MSADPKAIEVAERLEPDGDCCVAFAAAPDAIVLLSDDGLITGFNRAAEIMFGWTAEQALGQSLDLLRPAEDAGGLETFPPTIGADGPSVWEIVCIDKSGERFSVEVSAAACGSRSGSSWVVILRDVASRQGVVDALLVAEERLASITGNLPGIVFQRIRRNDGTITYPFFTDGVRDVLGYEPQEMRVTNDGCLDATHWADRERHRAAVEKSVHDLQPCIEEFRAITRNGEVRWLSGNSRPHVLANGEVLWDGLLIDITERKRAELRLEMIMDHAADSIITADEDGLIESANAAAGLLFGHTAEEMVARRISDFMAPSCRAEHDRRITQYLDTGEEELIAGTREYIGRRPDRSLFPFEMTTSEVRMEGRRLFIFIGRNISNRKRTEEALRESELRLRNIASNLPGIVFQRILRPDESLHYLYVSEGSRDLLGIEPAEIVADASVFLNALASGDRDNYLRALRHSATTLDPVEDELRVSSRDGTIRWLRGWSRPRRLASGEVAWDGVMLDVTDRKEAEERLRFLAYYDPITGVANRALFLDRLAEAASVAAANSTMVAVMCLGIDRFGVINSTLGHTVGDMVLAAAARRLQDCLGPGGLIARAGGDRFLILTPGCHSEADVLQSVDGVVACSAQPLSLMGDEFDLTASIGVSILPRDGVEPETVVKHADTALMRAKSQGPGTVRVFTEEMNESVVKTLTMHNRIRRALDAEEFLPFFQPQVDLSTGEIVGMEALARWISPELGMVSPVEFIPVAEEYGLIDPLCDQILYAACRINKSWQDAGLSAVPVAVNISGRQFQNSRRLLQTVEAVLSETGLDPCYLELELTESSAMRDPENAIAVVAQLRDRGIACSIDDFGTGYSSLSVLKRFPIQKLKIDRSFVSDVTTDANDAAIVKAILAMAHALRMKVVAEGVETTDHLEFLRDAACDQMQGYYFSRPLPAVDMEAMFRAGRRLTLPQRD